MLTGEKTSKGRRKNTEGRCQSYRAERRDRGTKVECWEGEGFLSMGLWLVRE